MADQIGDSDFALDPGLSRVFLHLMCIHCHASELKAIAESAADMSPTAPEIVLEATTELRS